MLFPYRQDFRGLPSHSMSPRELEVREFILLLNAVLHRVAAGGFADEVSLEPGRVAAGLE